MDATDSKVCIEVGVQHSKLFSTSELVSSPQLHNGQSIKLNQSYQIVLQDHNYGAPPPSLNCVESGSASQCKQESLDSVSTTNTIPHVPVIHHQKSGLKSLPSRQGPAVTVLSPVSSKSGLVKVNGTNNFPNNKRHRTSSGAQESNGVGTHTNTVAAVNVTPHKSYDSNKSNLSTTPLLVPKLGSNQYPCSAHGVGGDLNSHLYSLASNEKPVSKDEEKTNGPGGLSGYLGGWFSSSERARSRSDLRDSFNDDSNESINSPTHGTESDREGEETETAPECEGEEDEEQFEESITRCICKFGHDDGYMICCDRCSVWQHVECMNLDRNNIPEEYMCELCQPRRVDRARARAVQYRKRQEFRLSTPPPSGRDPRSMKEKNSKIEEFIDVERTQTPQKKLCRNNNGNTSGCHVQNPKWSRQPNNNPKNSVRAESQKTAKRGCQPKWKRKLEKNGDGIDGKERMTRKRKIFRSKSSGEAIDVVGHSSMGDSSPSTGRGGHGGTELLLQWIDHYEEAVTNHYSPELRARVSAVRPNGLYGDSFPPPSNTPAFRVASKAGGFKTLVTSAPVVSGTPIIEYRGKYMLSSQLRPYKSGGDGGGLATNGGLRSTPHILFHNLAAISSDHGNSPGSSIEMCVDGRSYGNEARFVWQSCQPNAEVKHRVEKGSLHLYLVSKLEISESEEITIEHDVKNPLPCPYEGCPHMTGSRDSGRTGLTSSVSASSSLLSTPVTPVTHEIGERKRRRRRTDSSVVPVTTDTPGTAAAASSPATPSPTVSSMTTNTYTSADFSTSPSSLPSVTATSLRSSNISESSNVTPIVAAVEVSLPPTTDSALPQTPIKRQQRTPSKTVAPIDGEDLVDGNPNQYEEIDGADHESTSHGKRKLSREERKMEAIMKAFERMEKAEQRRQEALARMAHRKDGKDDDCLGLDADVEQPLSPPSSDATTTALTESSTMTMLLTDRKNSNTYDTKSKALRRTIPMRKRGGGTRLRRTSSGTGVGSAGNIPGSRSRVRALSGEINSSHSATEGEESEYGGGNSSPSRVGKTVVPRDDSKDGLAHVMAFKCPKTKKVVFNNWTAAESGDLNTGRADMMNETSCGSVPLSLAVPMCYMRNPNPRSPTRPSRMAHLRPSTMSSLRSSLGSGSPDPHGEGGQSNDENLWTAPLPGSAGGSAKKRWLRQAISEETETESPTRGNGVGGGVLSGLLGSVVGVVTVAPATEVLDHVTPLKKRRLARASLSSETSFTPPSTPTQERGSGNGSGVTSGDTVPVEAAAMMLLMQQGHNTEGGVLKEGMETHQLESLPTDQSQATPPQSEDVEVIDPQQTPMEPNAETFAPSTQVTAPITINAVDQEHQQCNSGASLNSDPSGWCSAEGASSLLSLRYASSEGTYASPTRPTWEFRAPDAQFMRSRNASEISSGNDSVAPVPDSTQITSSNEERPKPVKKKLSILEYRQRKQNLTSDGSESSEGGRCVAISSDLPASTKHESPASSQPIPEATAADESSSSSDGSPSTATSLSTSSSSSTSLSDGDVEMSTA